MEPERLYHCLAGDKIMLVYKDNQEVLHCYEVEEKELVEIVRNCADRSMVDGILVGYAARSDGAHINKSAGQAGAEEPLSTDKKPTDAEQILSELRAGGSPGGEAGQGMQGAAADAEPGEATGSEDAGQQGRPEEKESAFLSGGPGAAAAEQPDQPAAAAEQPDQPAAAPEAAAEQPAAEQPDQPAAAPEAAAEQPDQPAPEEQAIATASDSESSQATTEGQQAEGGDEPQEGQDAAGEKAEQEAESGEKERNNVVFIGQKSTMDYVQATLTRLSNYHIVTITARGKRITLAVDVSQMIVKRMNKVGFRINEVRIGSDTMESEDGKIRNVSTIEIDVVDGEQEQEQEAGAGQPAA